MGPLWDGSRIILRKEALEAIRGENVARLPAIVNNNEKERGVEWSDK